MAKITHLSKRKVGYAELPQSLPAFPSHHNEIKGTVKHTPDAHTLVCLRQEYARCSHPCLIKCASVLLAGNTFRCA
eukprot:1155293-Amphidinium_carterae.1